MSAMYHVAEMSTEVTVVYQLTPAHPVLWYHFVPAGGVSLIVP